MIDWTGSRRLDASAQPDALNRIGSRLAQAAAGSGGIVYIERPRGGGKTELVAATAEAGQAAGMRVLRAGASALEREFPFGVAIQLFEETWFATGAGDRASLMEGPSRPGRGAALRHGARDAGSRPRARLRDQPRAVLAGPLAGLGRRRRHFESGTGAPGRRRRLRGWAVASLPGLHGGADRGGCRSRWSSRRSWRRRAPTRRR